MSPSSSSLALTAPPPLTKRPRGTGRKKIIMKKIERSNARQVTFSKRRKGLFNRARELLMLTLAEIAIIMFSPGGKLYTYGSSHVDLILENYFKKCNVVAEKKKKKNTGETRTTDRPWWDSPIEDLGLQELEEMKARVKELKDQVKGRVDRNWLSL